MTSRDTRKTTLVGTILEEDLGVNTPGVALVLDLLEELELVRARLDRIEP